MSVLHELLAVEQDAVAVATKLLEEGVTTFGKRVEHFQGHVQTVSYLAEDRKNENTSSSKEIVSTVDDKLGHVFKALSRLWDVKFQKDNANALAKADIIIGGKVLVKDVPSIYLLNMETHLKSVRELLLAVPTLEPAIKWTLDPAQGEGVYVAPATTTMRTEKTLQHKVIFQPTDKQAGVYEKWTEDLNVARVDTTKYSAMWTVTEKANALGRLDTLLDAIKTARQRANLVEVPKVFIGEELAKYILG